MTKPIDLDREWIACVFGLGGGALHEPHPDFPDEWDGVYADWNNGPPEYASEMKDANEVECPSCNDTGSDGDGKDCSACDANGTQDREVRTAIVNVL